MKGIAVVLGLMFLLSSSGYSKEIFCTGEGQRTRTKSLVEIEVLVSPQPNSTNVGIVASDDKINRNWDIPNIQPFHQPFPEYERYMKPGTFELEIYSSPRIQKMTADLTTYDDNPLSAKNLVCGAIR